MRDRHRRPCIVGAGIDDKQHRARPFTRDFRCFAPRIMGQIDQAQVDPGFTRGKAARRARPGDLDIPKRQGHAQKRTVAVAGNPPGPEARAHPRGRVGGALEPCGAAPGFGDGGIQRFDPDGGDEIPAKAGNTKGGQLTQMCHGDGLHGMGKVRTAQPLRPGPCAMPDQIRLSSNCGSPWAMKPLSKTISRTSNPEA